MCKQCQIMSRIGNIASRKLHIASQIAINTILNNYDKNNFQMRMLRLMYLSSVAYQLSDSTILQNEPWQNLLT